jgi:sigma-E factor negative regulatory protein RseA
MSTGSENQTTLAEDLSALVDGELHANSVTGACGRWRSDASARATWHAYQLIGDVLRSDDLASDAARDAAFLSALRERLAREPVVLAPQAAARPSPAMPVPGSVARRRRWSWAAPSAVAAGFVAVAGVLVVTRSPTLPPSAPAVASLAAAPAQSGGAVQFAGSGAVPSAVAPVSEPESSVATGKVIRDAGLDRYLAAHKYFAGSAALGVPSAFLRAATVDASGR